MPSPIFNGRYQVFTASAGGTGDYVFNGLFFDNSGYFTAANVSVGDQIYDPSGKQYTILVINSTAPTLNVDVSDDDGAVSNLLRRARLAADSL